MERLDEILTRLKAFAITRPVAYGAPACAMIGVLAGLAMRPGPQVEPYNAEMEPTRAVQQAYAEPIVWPTGKVPDYVIGVDFLKATQAPPPVEYATYEPPPPPEIPPYVPAEHGPAAPPPAVEDPHWASERGDILDVSLPEDPRPQPIPTVLAVATTQR